MRWTRWMRGAALALAGAIGLQIGCGGDADSWDDPDAGTGTCFTSLSVSPLSPQAPVTITLTGDIEPGGDPQPQGIEVYDWQVTGAGGQALSVTANDPDSRSVSFQAEQPGVYSVWLAGSVGTTSCSASAETFNVSDPGARTARYRLRVMPGAVPQTQPTAPAQDVMITVLGGADAHLDTIVLDDGAVAQGQVETTTGQPLAAYLRARPTTAGKLVREGFAGQDGRFWLRLVEGVYDVLVIPEDNAFAPVRVAGMAVTADDGPVTVMVAPGHAVAGAVVDSAGAPVAGARVSMRIDGVPSTIATTAADGSFSLRTSALGPASLSVVPAAGSSLPELEVAADAGLVIDSPSGNDSLDIAYQALATRTLVVPARLSDGVTAAAGARITWIARPVAGAARVTLGAQSVTAQGTVRRAVVADSSGATAAVSLIEGVHDVIVEPGADAGPDQGVALRQVDLSAGQPAPAWLALAPPARITGTVTRGPDGAGGQPAGAVEIRATATGILARTLAAGARATTAADGSFELAVAGGGSHDITFTGPEMGGGRVWQTVQAPAAGQSQTLGTVALPATLMLSGQVRIPWLTSAEGVHLMLLCGQCSGADADRPMAETVAGAGGTFELRVPDPGVIAGARTMGAQAEADAR